MMIGSGSGSEKIMHLVKPNTIGAEIGVWKGKTSIEFLKKGLKKLYLIDPYAVDNYEYLGEEYMNNFYAKYSKITGEFSKAGFMRFYDNLYEHVYGMVKGFEEAEMCRMTSDDWFDSYKAALSNGLHEHLDWIYIDGDHSYEATTKDLNNSLDVVRSGGIIMGDDYNASKKGTTEAVNKFIKDNGLNLFTYGTQFQINL